MDYVGAIIGVLGTILGGVLSYAAFHRNSKKDSESEGKEAGTMLTEIGYIKGGIDRIERKQDAQDARYISMAERMSAVDCDKFAGMLDANSISGTRDILRLTEHLDDYVILPGCSSAQSIGKYLVGCGVFPVPEKLIGYINYEAVGIEFCDAHGGAACSRGFVVRKEGLPKAVLDDLHTSKQTYEMTL